MTIYLDNNATTPVAPEVVDAMIPWLREGYGNPSSVHGPGRRAAAALTEARAAVAALAGCRESEIIFTSCGTESINSAIRSAIALDPDKRHIITSTVEHSATIKLCEHLAKSGYEITWLPVDSHGHLDIERLEASIRPDTALVSLLWANNETGVLFPVEAIAEITHRKKCLLHVDAVQAFGKLPLKLEGSGIHFLSMSGHKLHAPKGVAALYANHRVRYRPLLLGSQEEARRGGTQNLASIVGFGVAASLAAGHVGDTSMAKHRDDLENHLIEHIPGCTVNGDRVVRLPNTTNISFPGVEGEELLLLLDEHGICCSAGSACTSGSVHPSHVLRAMGLSTERARSSLRFSLSRYNTDREIKTACEQILRSIKKLKAARPAGAAVVRA